MERKKENRLSMYDAIVKLCGIYATVIATIPYFVGYYTRFKEILAQIHGRNESLERDIKGTSVVKRQKREELIDATMNIALKVKAYAIHTDKTELEKQVNYSRWDLIKEPDALLQDSCKLINGIATQILTELEEAGVTQEMLDKQILKMNDYISYAAAPRVKRVEKKEWKYQMNLLFKEADALLKKMDGMVATMVIDNPEAYHTYMGARHVIDLKGKKKIHTGITGVITDFETEEALEGAEVWTDNNAAHVFTDKNGSYTLETDAGETKFHVRKVGYTDYEEEIETETGLVTENDIEMEQVEMTIPAGTEG